MIEGFEEEFNKLDSLKYLNLRENKISDLKEFVKLKDLSNLRTLIHSFNPFIPNNHSYLLETINMLLKITRLNKVHITKNVKLRALNFAEEKWLKE